MLVVRGNLFDFDAVMRIIAIHVTQFFLLLSLGFTPKNGTLLLEERGQGETLTVAYWNWNGKREGDKIRYEMCGIDESVGVVVHRFNGGSIVCRCKELIIRSPVRRQRVGHFGRGFSDYGFDDGMSTG